ncbi:MAG: alpha/beta hydrolase [Gemmatimonadota bacterium]|jgi:pimeloyl-ACP methyl ester carboxylesterase|nr:alpha/beta hydrolase [Gemmatimonadota bacterium]
MLHYKTFELGPEHEWVVFVHGAGGSSSIWFKQIRDFRRHFNVLLVDLRGHGESQNPFQIHEDATYTFQDVSREIVEVLDDAGIPSAHFVGISLGCILIRTIGEIAPERVRSMVLGGAVTRLNLRSRILVRGGDALKRFIPFFWLYRLFAWIIMPKKRHEQSRMLFVGEAKKLAQKEFLRWYRLSAELNPLMKLFEERELAIPTLYIMGDEDHMFLAPVRNAVRKHPRYSRLEVLQDSGHVVNVDQPERFNRTAIDFMHGVGLFRPCTLPAGA